MSQPRPPTLGRLLVVDDEALLLEALCARLTRHGFDVACYSRAGEALKALEAGTFDVLLSDLMMPEVDGIQLVRAALQIDPHLVPVIMTGQGTVQTAVEAMQAGAFDYVLKPFNLQAVLPVLSRALQVRRLRVENVQLRETMAVYELSQAIAYRLDTNTLVSRLASGAQDLLGADEVSVLLPVDGAKEFFIAAARGEGRDHLLGERVPADRGIAGWVVRHQEPLLLNGPVEDPVLTPSHPRPEIVSAVSYPLVVGGKLVGLLNINLLQRKRPFTLGQVKALGILAGTAAAGLEAAALLAEVRRTEADYRRIVQTAAEGVWVVGPDDRTTFVNDRFARMLGYAAADLVGRPASELVDDAGRARAAAPPDGRPAAEEWFDLPLRRKDGGVIWTTVSAAALPDDAGRPAGVLRMVTDLTHRRQLEDQLRQAQKMEAVGRLAGGVAHDFNNLLTVINGYSELLQTEPGLAAPARDLLREIRAAGERAAGLTRQLLAFSRKQVLAPVVLDLNALVTELTRMLERLVGEDVDLAAALAPHLGLVRADPGQVEQIILNLVVNARDAMPRGGKLTIETRDVELDESYARDRVDVRPGPYVLLAITDTGVGMTDEVKARAFEPFFTTKGPEKGTGLGLSTVYGIVKQSGGHVAVYSEPGHGTTFKVYLPRVEETERARRGGSKLVESPRGTETILLVEDEEAVRRLARLCLEMCGYTVLEAAGGAEAGELAARGGRIDLLVTDVIMPGMSGREVAEHLQTHQPGLKVLYLSGYTDDAVVRHGILACEASFLQKPFTPLSLGRKVREVLDAPGPPARHPHAPGSGF